MFVVFDIDGTLADPTHRLHYIQGEDKDWDAFFAACGEDRPIYDALMVCESLYEMGHYIEFWTGRPEAVREETVDWLGSYLGEWATFLPLRMREDGDYRPDHQVKPEFLEQTNMGRPRLIIEDRNGPVLAFRDLGLTVWQVCDGDY